MKKILPFFSYIFHPLFISVYAIILYFSFGNWFFVYQEIYLIIILVLIVTILIPASVYYLLLSLGKTPANTTQRKTSLFIHTVLLFILIQKSITIDAIPELYYFFTANLISAVIVLLLLITNYRISLHMTGISSLILFTIGISIHNQIRLIEVIAFLVLCMGFVASSRLSLKGHHNKELILGIIAGIVPQTLLWYFWL